MGCRQGLCLCVTAAVLIVLLLVRWIECRLAAEVLKVHVTVVEVLKAMAVVELPWVC